MYYKGYHGDVSETYLVGNVDTDGQKLVRVAEECRDRGISVCKPGAQFSEIGIAIEYVFNPCHAEYTYVLHYILIFILIIPAIHLLACISSVGKYT